MDEPVGSLIRRRRIELGLTQLEVERRTGIEQYYISQIERAKVLRPGRHYLEAFAAALNLPLDVLLLAADYAPEGAGAGKGVLPAGVANVAPVWLMRSNTEGYAMDVPQRWLSSRDPQDFFIVQLTDDTLTMRGLVPNDYALCVRDEQYGGDDLVAVRAGDAVSLMVVSRASASDAEVIGVYTGHRWSE